MRICVLSEYFHPDNTGGTGPVMSGLVRHLKDHYDGLEIDVITSNKLFRGQADAIANNRRLGRRLDPPALLAFVGQTFDGASFDVESGVYQCGFEVANRWVAANTI